MAVITNTNTPRRHVMGELVLRHYTLSGNNGDTFTLVSQQNPIHVSATPTTAIAVGCTIAGNVITFVTVGAWAADVAVWSREG